MKEINETFEMFKDCVYSPELKELIASIQVMYNQKEELQQRINKAIRFINGDDLKEGEYRFAEDFDFSKLLDILRGVDKK